MQNLQVKLEMVDSQGDTTEDRAAFPKELMPVIEDSLEWNGKRYKVYGITWTPQASAQQVILHCDSSG